MAVVYENKLGAFNENATKNVRALGQSLVEGLKLHKGIDFEDAQKEQLAKFKGVAKEDITIGETDLYTTAISDFIEQKLEPVLVAEGVIKKITNFDAKGNDSIKVPIRQNLITAADLPDSGAVTYDGGTYESTTITLRYVHAAQKMTREILAFANVDLMAEELGQIGSAIGRKMDSDIITAMQTATTTPNGNLTNLGATATVTFDNLVDGRKSMLDNNGLPNVMLVSPETEATIYKLGEFSGASTQVGALNVSSTAGNAFPLPQQFLGMRLVVSQQVDDDDVFLVDGKIGPGYLVENGQMEVYDGRVSGSVAFEVIGAKAYGVGIVQPKAVFRIQENAA